MPLSSTTKESALPEVKPLGRGIERMPILRPAQVRERPILLSLWEKMAVELIRLGAFRWQLQRLFVESAYLFDRYLSETLRGVVTFAEWNGDIVGFTLIGEQEDTPDDAKHIAQIHGIYVEPSERKFSTAKRMLMFSMFNCQRMGLTEFHANVLIVNKPVIALAQSLNFNMHSVNIVRKNS